MTPNAANIALVELARLGAVMRRAQRAYFEKRRRMPHVAHDAEWRAARDAEKRFDAAVIEALNSERPSLPGMEAEGEMI